MGWVKANDKKADGFKLARIIGTDKSFPAMFAPHVIAGADGKTYKKENIEWFDDSVQSFTINDIKLAYDTGWSRGFNHNYDEADRYIKQQYNIDMP